MNNLDTIIIADSYQDRVEELFLLTKWFAPEVAIFNGTWVSDKAALTREVESKANQVLWQWGKIMLITNCIMWVQEWVIRAIRWKEADHNNGARKILFTCKGRAEVKRWLDQRGVSRIGIRHVVWDGEDVRHHQDEMRRILRSTSPATQRLKPWETLQKVWAQNIIVPEDNDDQFSRNLKRFPGTNSIIGYTMIQGKRYLVAEKEGQQMVYTQLAY